MKTKPKRSMAAPQRKPLLRTPRGKLRQPATLRQAIPEELVSIPEAALMLARSIATLHRWIGRGLIRAMQIGFTAYVRRPDIDWWLSPRPYTGRPPVPPWLETPEPESSGKGQPSSVAAVGAPADVGEDALEHARRRRGRLAAPRGRIL